MQEVAGAGAGALSGTGTGVIIIGRTTVLGIFLTH
jgi:hypothetical protein